MTPEPTEIPGEVQGEPGAVAKNGGAQVTLNVIQDPWTSDNEFIQPDAGKRFVAFDVTIENPGDSGTHSANPFNFKLTDAESFAYDPTFFGPDPQLGSVDLGSHEKTRGWITFQVNQATPLKLLKYDPNFFTTDDIEFRFD